MSIELIGGALLGVTALAVGVVVWRKRSKGIKPELYTVEPGEMTKADMFRFLTVSKAEKQISNVHDFLPDEPQEHRAFLLDDPMGDPDLTRKLREAIEKARSEVPRKENKDI
ncbi:hypothetical protein V0N53_004592 [Salmonella enterica]|nr:hypothetical protein [Salmonella enterica]